MRRPCYTISRDSGLFSTQIEAKDPTRFVEAFQEVWQSVSFVHRRILTMHWRHWRAQWLLAMQDALHGTVVQGPVTQGAHQPNSTSASPNVQPQEKPPHYTKGWTLAEVLVGADPLQECGALSQRLGCYRSPQQPDQWPRLVFWAHAVDHMTDEVLRVLIARILASACVAASQEELTTVNIKPKQNLSPLRLDGARDNEVAAHELMKEWGFSPQLLTQWMGNHPLLLEDSFAVIGVERSA